MGIHREALIRLAGELGFPEPQVFLDNGYRSGGPLPALTRLIRLVASGFCQVVLVPGPFVFSLDDDEARTISRSLTRGGCRVLELSSPHQVAATKISPTVAPADYAPGHTCTHRPCCPPAEAADHDAARLVVSHPEQGWSLLCNGVIAFEDTGELLPDGHIIEPHRWGEFRVGTDRPSGGRS